MKLIAGLGNPGAAYVRTRHNIGFLAADRLAVQAGITLRKQNYEALTGCGSWLGNDIVIAEPLTFMNRSGSALRAIAEDFGLSGEGLIVIHDDMDLPFGAIRIKTNGGSGGHRGIESIQESVCTDAFTRLRIGIGRPTADVTGSDYVLGAFSDAELKEIPALCHVAVECLAMILTLGIPAAMNAFHSRTKSAE